MTGQVISAQANIGAANVKRSVRCQNHTPPKAALALGQAKKAQMTLAR